ncbi:MAG: thiamine phosphate synthase [Beijerinckiaceae bacterium]
MRVYFVTDAPLSAGRGVVETAVMAARGGATMVQLRDPLADRAALLAEARALVAALHPLGVPVIVNDRPDVARESGAAGCHIGQSDVPAADARRIIGDDAILGLSITDPAQMVHVPWEIVDHLGVGPVVSKGVKADAAEPMGFDGLAACVNLSRKPIVAIGGMTLEAASRAIAAGADGVAVVAAIAGAGDPEAAARALRRAVDASLEARGGCR